MTVDRDEPAGVIDGVMDPLEWVCAGSERDLRASTLRAVQLGGESVLLVQLGDEIRAVHNECPHRQVALDLGELSGRSLVCPLHRRLYNLDTGLCETPRPDGRPRRDTPPLVFYRTMVRDGQVWVATTKEPS
jgi:nitrite reductase/ring-hydroxylating ferredoxin subunit